MKVYKFGGASVRNAAGVRNLRRIIGQERQLFVIVLPMAETTATTLSPARLRLTMR